MHPRNWRAHPDSQRAALRGILEEIGFAGALLTRELPDGRLQLIDGHLRAEELHENKKVPVLITDLTEEEALKLLLLHDPIARMAEFDPDALASLTAEVETDEAAVQALIDELAAECEPPDDETGADDEDLDTSPQLDEETRFSTSVDHGTDEKAQIRCIEVLKKHGFPNARGVMS